MTYGIEAILEILIKIFQVPALRAKGMLGPFLVEVMLLLPVVEDFVPSMCHESISIQWVKTYKHHWALDPA